MNQLDSTNDFYSEINEVSILLTYSKRNSRDIKKYQVFVKGALILLCTMFEIFLQNCLEEYAYQKLRNLDGKRLDSYIYKHIENLLFKEMEENNKKRPKCIKLLYDLNSLDCYESYSDYIKPKFKYGKHGQKEITRLLMEFGFHKFTEVLKKTDFFGQFNSIVNKRNYIIHEGKMPNLTHRDVEKHLERLKNFVEGMNKHCIEKLSST